MINYTPLLFKCDRERFRGILEGILIDSLIEQNKRDISLDISYFCC
nr:MAG TPA: hypothetical protein [Caudoviricetes sp.]